MNRHIYSLFAGCLLALTALQPLLHAQPRYDKALIQSEIERHESSLRRTPSGTASTTALDVKYYRLDLVITTTPQYLKGSVLMNALSTQNGLGSISLDLMSSMTIDSVTVGGAQASFAQLATSFNVTLDRNYDAGELMSVEVFYRGKPGSSGFGSFAFSAHSSTPWVWSLSEPYGAKDWWPCNDHPSDKADSVDIIIRCDSAYKVGSNGKLLAVTDNGDGTDTYRWHEGYPISTYLVSVAITNYAEFSNWFKYTPTDSMEILNYVLPEHLSSAVSQLPRVVDELRIYSDLFGLYPFINEKYGHSEFGWGGGMEHQTMTSLGGFSEYLTAHELAHQWFGDMITCRTWPDIWLNEGFATFCELLYEREQYGEATYLNGMLSDMADAKTSTRSLYVSDSGSVGSLFSWSRVYAKGSVVLHMLRRVLGDSIFFQAMYNYANDPRFRFATASTGDFQEVCESTSAMSLGYFFNEWVYGERYPRYTTSWTADSIGSGYVVTIGVRQTTLTLNPPFFTMPVDFKMIAPGWDTTVTLMNNAQEQSFAVMSSHRPVSVVLDPGRWILCDKDTLRAYAAAPAAISMGDVFVFGFKSDSIIVTNPGLVALNITSAATDDPVFTVSPASATIAASASRAFVVTFHPTLSGARSAHLYLAHNAAQSPGVVNISGRAIGYTIANRWNLVSLPVTPPDPRTATLFPWALSPAYSYAGAGGYLSAETLHCGVGYWLKSDSARTIALDGEGLALDTIRLSTGWNLVGSISAPVAAQNITSNPPGMATSQFFGYQGSYVIADTIVPGKAYWVKSDQAGELIVSSSSPGLNSNARIRIVAGQDAPPPPPDGGAPPRNAQIPERFALMQNYPNPFNPFTTIRYDLPVSAHVNLAIYNILGEEVALLVDGVQDAGSRSVSFDADRLPSGMYTCRLTAGEFSAVTKMLLMR